MYEKQTSQQHIYNIQYKQRERDRAGEREREREKIAKYLQMCTVIQMYHDFYALSLTFSCVLDIIYFIPSQLLCATRVRLNRAYLGDFIECLFAYFMLFRGVYIYIFWVHVYIEHLYFNIIQYLIYIEFRKRKRTHTLSLSFTSAAAAIFFAGSSEVIKHCLYIFLPLFSVCFSVFVFSLFGTKMIEPRREPRDIFIFLLALIKVNIRASECKSEHTHTVGQQIYKFSKFMRAISM